MRLTRLVLAAVLTVLVVTVPATPAAASPHTVSISGYGFHPATLTVTAGDTVTWTNSDQAPHDVTTTSAPVAIHGSTMNKGQSWSYTFTKPGTYAYICSIHPDMKATVIVRPAPAPRTSARTTARPAVVRPRSTVIARTGGMAMPPHVRSSRTSTSATPTAAPATSSPPAAPVAADAPPAAPPHPLRPLLIVAGIVAAVATLCLLLLAARAEGPGPTAG